VTPQVTFLGPIPHGELVHHYSEADVLVFPALRDSGGSALLEAMSLGLPVVCLDWGGPAEMLDDQCGIKVPIATPQETILSFAEALIRLDQHPELRLQLGVNAARHARANFTWERKRQILEETYERLLSLSKQQDRDA